MRNSLRKYNPPDEDDEPETDDDGIRSGLIAVIVVEVLVEIVIWIWLLRP